MQWFADKVRIIRLLKLNSTALALVFFLLFPVCVEAALPDSTNEVPSVVVQDSSKNTEESAGDATSEDENFFEWTFNHFFQPLLNKLIWPIAAPLRYAFDNGVVETAQDLVTFGERKNIMVYPVFNLKPGNSTLTGVTFRHRNVLLDHDYFYMSPNFYANSDIYFTARYTKQGFFGTPLIMGTRYTLNLDRDATFILPDTWTSFTQPDSSAKWEVFLGFPLNASGTLNLQFNGYLRYVDASVPDAEEDSILIDDKFPIEDRGLYQSHLEIPFGVTFVYDDLDYPFAPSRGSRFKIHAEYNIVHGYHGVKYEDLGLANLHGGRILRDGGLNHDYIYTEVIFQHYFYFGKAQEYVMSVSEGRKNRKFYTDFSWDEAVRIWKPENVMETLLERRVIALQFRMNNMFEMEKGGAPFDAYNLLNARFPLRGYGGSLVSKHILGLSAEYRWPVDRYVEGVIFDEYAMYSDKLYRLSPDRFVNSWGIGVRVRKPDMYLFRLQFGFHGLQGVNLVLTIAPEFK